MEQRHAHINWALTTTQSFKEVTCVSRSRLSPETQLTISVLILMIVKLKTVISSFTKMDIYSLVSTARAMNAATLSMNDVQCIEKLKYFLGLCKSGCPSGGVGKSIIKVISPNYSHRLVNILLIYLLF